MLWQPTTRGIDSGKELCHYKDCLNHNDDTNYYVVDAMGPRFFCTPHWTLTGFLFKLIKECPKCCRNHNADWFRDSVTVDTVKYQNQWWELCVEHYTIYDDMVMLILP